MMGSVRLRFRFDTNVSCYLEKCKEINQTIEDAGNSVIEYQVRFNTVFFSQTFLYLNCGSTTKLTFPFKIRVKNKYSKNKPKHREKEVCAVLSSTFFLTSHCLFPLMSMMSLHYKTEPLLRASS